MILMSLKKKVMRKLKPFTRIILHTIVMRKLKE